VLDNGTHHFGCTQCGKCCHSLKLPLTAQEAIGWLKDGNSVQVLCEALPWPLEPAADDLQAAHRRRRSFATRSGSLSIRVTAILVANFSGPCPNLQADFRCGIYQRRPLVCRIYPLEINPFIQLKPTHKACPAEAWTADKPLIQQGGQVVDHVAEADIRKSRETDALEVETKRAVCIELGLNSAALVSEGFVVYSPDPAVLLVALTAALHSGDLATSDSGWQLVSSSAKTVEALCESGAIGRVPVKGDRIPYQYVGLQP